MTNQSTKHIYWINAVKAICMLTVYFQHTITLYGINIDGYNPQYITSYYVNGFFLISGYLLFWKSMQTTDVEWFAWGSKSVKNIIYKIALPSILFSLEPL